MAKLTPKPASDPARTKQLAAIHAMRREVGLGEDDYRALVGRVSGGRTESAGELAEAGRAALLDALRKLGGGRGQKSAVYGPPEQRAKARALWIALAEAGGIKEGSDKALNAFIKRQTQKDLGTLPPEAWKKVIEALKAMLRRAGARAGTR